MNTTTTTDFRALGRAAFAASLPMIPATDPAIQTAIADLPVGGGAAQIMRAWSAGWTEANLAAPVEMDIEVTS